MTTYGAGADTSALHSADLLAVDAQGLKVAQAAARRYEAHLGLLQLGRGGAGRVLLQAPAAHRRWAAHRGLAARQLDLALVAVELDRLLELPCVRRIYIALFTSYVNLGWKCIFENSP